MNTVNKIDVVAVKSLFDHYHNKVKTHPTLYRSSDTCITVILPKSILEYSNASAGHSGYGAGARPCGIRISCDNSTKKLAEIFNSVESLTKFILSSDCSGPEYVEGIKRRHAERLVIVNADPLDAPVKTVSLNQRYGSGIIQYLLAKFPTVKNEYQLLTIFEFEQRYGLAAI